VYTVYSIIRRLLWKREDETALFWVVTQRVAISYRSFGTTFRHLQQSTWDYFPWRWDL